MEGQDKVKNRFSINEKALIVCLAMNKLVSVLLRLTIIPNGSLSFKMRATSSKYLVIYFESIVFFSMLLTFILLV